MNKLNLSYLAFAAAVILAGCNSAGSITKKADKQFKNQGAYAEAIKLYQDALTKEGADKGYINGQIAESYRLSNRTAQALPFYQAAMATGAKADSLKFYYAQSLQANGKYDSAATAYTDYAKTGGNAKLVKRAKNEAEDVKQVSEIMKKRSYYEISNVEGLNTASADYGPFLNNNELYFASDRNASGTYKGNGEGFTDIYDIKLDATTGKPGTESAVALPSIINKPGVHKASATISKDGNTMVFARGNDGSRKGAKNVDLYQSKKKDGVWSEPELMSLSMPDAWDACPAYSPDGKSLYFASDRAGGQGGSDIYRATQDANGKWTKVANMGASINTDGDEAYPFISEDGKLFFASDGHPSLGNLDLFVAVRGTDKTITVQNLGVPINSSADDFGIYFKTPVDGYFTSNREGGKGSDDIYYFRDSKNDLRVVKFDLSGVTQQKDDKGATTILPDTKVKLLDDKGEVVAETVSDAEGKFKFALASGKNYTLYGDHSDYYAKREPFTTFGKNPPQEELTQPETTLPLTSTVTLDKIKLQQTFVLDNIYYDYNKADIRPEAAAEIDKLVEILKDNPGITIELSSHTDNRGKADYNQRLSQHRAESAVNYIVSKGIDAKRVIAKGYGMTTPIIENAVTEEDYQKNRRTEFKVLKNESK